MADLAQRRENGALVFVPRQEDRPCGLAMCRWRMVAGLEHDRDSYRWQMMKSIISWKLGGRSR
jgi:hypothetical protein